MSLEDQLAAIRTMAASRIPPDALATMHQATDDLRDSGIVERVIKVGSPLPSFALSNAHGQVFRSQDLLQRGAIVLSVFRGHW